MNKIKNAIQQRKERKYLKKEIDKRTTIIKEVKSRGPLTQAEWYLINVQIKMRQREMEQYEKRKA